jgi:phosphate-selective porin OprO/OprP
MGDLRRVGKRSASTLFIAVSVACLGLASIEAGADELAELRERLDVQARQIEALERQLGNRSGAAPAKRANEFVIRTEDGENRIRLRGVLHFDGRHFEDDFTPETADTFLLRRVRPSIEGTLNGLYDFRFVPDFAGGRTIILDAYLAARLRPWAVLTAGKFKVPVGLERLVSASDLRFIERAFPTSLLPNRDLGVQLSGEVAGGAVTYSVGYFNGVSDGGSSDGQTPADAENDTKGDWAARVFFQPFLKSDGVLRGLGFGLAGTYVDSTGTQTTTLLPGYRTPGQQTFFSYRGASSGSATFADGERIRLTPQFHYFLGRFGALGEYARVRQDVTRVTSSGARMASLEHDAWHLQLAWSLTGEEQSLKGLKPASDFSLDRGTWGAFELVARYHELDIDDAAFAGGADSFADPATAASQARAWGVGLNWYLNRNYKVAVNYDVTRFDGGAAGGADRPDERALFTRFAVGF